jgi:hypothetical protein
VQEDDAFCATQCAGILFSPGGDYKIPLARMSWRNHKKVLMSKRLTLFVCAVSSTVVIFAPVMFGVMNVVINIWTGIQKSETDLQKSVLAYKMFVKQFNMRISSRQRK